MQAYNLPLESVLKLTIPQIVLLSHASWFNGKRFERRLKQGDAPNKPRQHDSPDFDNMTSDQWAAQIGGAFG